jgi:hypothetical protein
VAREPRKRPRRPAAPPPLILAAALAVVAPSGCAPQAPPPAAPVVAIASGDPPPPAAAPPLPGAPAKAAPAPPLAWERDEPAARARARREGRPLIVYLRADWSAGSLSMDREVWSDARVLAEARAFVPLWLDLTRAEGDAELYAQRYGATAIPALALFDPEGRAAARLLGAQGAPAVVAALRAVIDSAD